MLRKVVISPGLLRTLGRPGAAAFAATPACTMIAPSSRSFVQRHMAASSSLRSSTTADFCRRYSTAISEPDEDDDEDDEDGEEGAAGAFKRKSKLEANFYGIAHVQSTFNNTIVNVTNVGGDTLCWSSGGAAEGYRGSRKKTPFAGQLAAEKAVAKALVLGVRSIRIRVKGIGRGRETALRALITSEVRPPPPTPDEFCCPGRPFRARSGMKALLCSICSRSKCSL